MNLQAVVDRFPDAKIAIFGDVMLDQFIYGTVSRTSPEAPVPVVDLAYTENRLGGCGNVANNISSFNATTYLFGIAGHDFQAEILSKLLKDQKISDMLIKGDRPTTTKQRIIAHKQQIVRVDNELRAPINASQEDEIISHAKETIKNVDVLILSDYSKGFLTDSLCKSLIEISRKSGKPVIVDPKSSFSKYSGADLITPNFEEFGRFSGLEISKDPENVMKNAAKIMKSHNIGRILVTMGEHGMMLFENNRYFQVNALKNGYDVVDITGAGDTAIAVFALSIATGASYVDAMRLANFAAGVVVTKFGTATCNSNELKSMLECDDSLKEVII